MYRLNLIVQRKRFSKNRKQFRILFKQLENLGKEPFVMPFWNNVNVQVKKAFLPTPTIDFLSIRVIRDTMFVEGDQVWLDAQVKYLKKYEPDYRKLLPEEKLGSPKLLPAPHIGTSHNNIHHLYHLVFFFQHTKTRPDDIKTVVEWGGGYGNFAKLWMRKFDFGTTYVIIDTALFCTIEWLYLSSILGEEKVNVVKGVDTKIVPNKINLVPLALLDKVEIKGDLFVSTWGLSESSKSAQDYVINKKWFGAKHLLIGFQDSTKDLKHASRLGKLAAKSGAKIIDIKFIPNNHYAIK